LRRPGQRGQLRVDVKGRVPARGPAGVAGLQQLPDLGVAERIRLRRGRRGVAVEREPAAADPVIGAAAGDQRDDRRHRGERHDHDDHDRQRVGHGPDCRALGRSSGSFRHASGYN
jgi:hypothetical protein